MDEVLSETETATETVRLRCGDVVKHGPTGEEWLVAYADYERGRLSRYGWPEGFADLSDCTLVRAATDAEHEQAVREWAASNARKDNGGSDHRRAVVLHLYGSVLGS